MARETKAQQAEREEAIKDLRGMLERGQTVYTKVDHVSRSGMMRHISVYIANERAEHGEIRPAIVNINWYVSRAIGWTRANDGGIKVAGCGMDMGFHLVYSLASVLFRDDPEETEEERAECPRYMGVDPWKHRHGYALTQKWL